MLRGGGILEKNYLGPTVVYIINDRKRVLTGRMMTSPFLVTREFIFNGVIIIGCKYS